MTIAVLALVTFLAGLTLLVRTLGWRRILKLHAVIDVLFTGALFLLFAGTLTGTLVAAAAGLMLSLTLSAARGVARLTRSLAPKFG